MKKIMNARQRILAALALALVLAAVVLETAWAQGQIQNATTWTVGAPAYICALLIAHTRGLLKVPPAFRPN